MGVRVGYTVYDWFDGVIEKMINKKKGTTEKQGTVESPNDEEFYDVSDFLECIDTDCHRSREYIFSFIHLLISRVAHDDGEEDPLDVFLECIKEYRCDSFDTGCLIVKNDRSTKVIGELPLGWTLKMCGKNDG